MNTAKVYQDMDGNDCTIHQMVERDPHWAASRIQVGEDAIEKIAALESQLAENDKEIARMRPVVEAAIVHVCYSGLTTLRKAVDKYENSSPPEKKP